MPSRVRSRGSSDVPTYFPGEYRIFYNDHATTTLTYNGSRNGRYEWMSDVVTPGFARKRNNHEIINSPMSRYVYNYTAIPSTVVFSDIIPTWNGIGHTIRQEGYNLLAAARGPLHPPNQPGNPAGDLLHNWVPSLDEDRLMNLAATKALSDSNGKSAQGLVIAAEMQKTLDTLRHPLKASFTALRNIPKILRQKGSGNIPLGQLKNVASGASNQYLTWFYGLRTIMFDIEDIQKALSKKISDRVTGRGFQDDSTFSIDVVPCFSSQPYQADLTFRYDELVEFRAGALVQLDVVPSLSDNLGFSLRKVPEAAWELLPWSFVVDWFVNVGDSIGALQAAMLNKFLAQWITRKRTLKFTNTVSNFAFLPAYTNWVVNQPCVDTEMVVVEMYDRFPTNLGKYVLPTLQLSLKKVPTLAAISLAVQQLTKR